MPIQSDTAVHELNKLCRDGRELDFHWNGIFTLVEITWFSMLDNSFL